MDKEIYPDLPPTSDARTRQMKSQDCARDYQLYWTFFATSFTLISRASRDFLTRTTRPSMTSRLQTRFRHHPLGQGSHLQ